MYAIDSLDRPLRQCSGEVRSFSVGESELSSVINANQKPTRSSGVTERLGALGHTLGLNLSWALAGYHT